MTRKEFHNQLGDLTARLDDMATLAKGMLRDGVQAFENLDRALAKDVDGRKEMLADLDEEIEATALNLLALQGPMASDLRRIGATLKLISYLNRIGRYGRDIGNALNRWAGGTASCVRDRRRPEYGGEGTGNARSRARGISRKK